MNEIIDDSGYPFRACVHVCISIHVVPMWQEAHDLIVVVHALDHAKKQ